MVVAFSDSGRPQFEALCLQISKKFSTFERTKKKQGLSFQPRSVWTQNILANDTKYNPEKSSIKNEVILHFLKGSGFTEKYKLAFF